MKHAEAVDICEKLPKSLNTKNTTQVESVFYKWLTSTWGKTVIGQMLEVSDYQGLHK